MSRQWVKAQLITSAQQFPSKRNRAVAARWLSQRALPSVQNTQTHLAPYQHLLLQQCVCCEPWEGFPWAPGAAASSFAKARNWCYLFFSVREVKKWEQYKTHQTLYERRASTMMNSRKNKMKWMRAGKGGFLLNKIFSSRGTGRTCLYHHALFPNTHKHSLTSWDSTSYCKHWAWTVITDTLPCTHFMACLLLPLKISQKHSWRTAFSDTDYRPEDPLPANCLVKGSPGVHSERHGCPHTEDLQQDLLFKSSLFSDCLTCWPFRIKVPNQVRTFAFVPSSKPLTKHTRSLTPSSEDSFLVWSNVKATPRPGRWHSST